MNYFDQKPTKITLNIESEKSISQVQAQIVGHQRLLLTNKEARQQAEDKYRLEIQKQYGIGVQEEGSPRQSYMIAGFVCLLIMLYWLYKCCKKKKQQKPNEVEPKIVEIAQQRDGPPRYAIGSDGENVPQEQEINTEGNNQVLQRNHLLLNKHTPFIDPKLYKPNIKPPLPVITSLYEKFGSETIMKSQNLSASQKQGASELKKNYQIDHETHVLGQGAFGKVYKTHNKYCPSHKVAIKVLDKIKMSRQNMWCSMQEEIKILTKLDHPNIVKYYETYIDEKYIYLVMEFIGGGEMKDRMDQQKKNMYSEDVARGYMKKLFGACHYMHSQQVIHRDIKPENIMFTHHDNEIKLIDFGLSKKHQVNQKLTDMAGTPMYMAPEVLEKDGMYDSKCDLWSLGVLLYLFMSGQYPFQGNSKNEIFHKVLTAPVNFDDIGFSSCSKDVIDLIQQLLEKDPQKRLSARMALKHEWFKNYEALQQKVKIDSQVLNRLMQFKGVSKLKKVAMNLFVKMADYQEIRFLRGEFVKIDTDCSGVIDKHEIMIAFKNSNIRITFQQIDQIISECNYISDKGEICYTEFLTATLDVRQFMGRDMLRALFSQFDTMDQGYITHDNIITAMNKIGREISQAELEEIMFLHDLDKNGVISQEEFKQIFI